MFAVVEIAGVQFDVEPNAIVKVPLLEGNPGDTVEFNNIILSGDGDKTNLGSPYLSGKVQARILEHGKEPTVLVFKKKRRKGYRKLNGHRQHFTKIEITNINL
jgi:large subunit ribosomal protein L21